MAQEKSKYIEVLEKLLETDGEGTVPISFLKLCKKYKSTHWKTDYCSDYIQRGIKTEFQDSRKLISFFTAKQIVQLAFLLSLHISDELEKILKDAGELRLDDQRKIASFKSTDGLFERAGKHKLYGQGRKNRANNTNQDTKEEENAEEPAPKRRNTRGGSRAQVQIPLVNGSPRAHIQDNDAEVEDLAQDEEELAPSVAVVDQIRAQPPQNNQARVDGVVGIAAPKMEPEKHISNTIIFESLLNLICTINSDALAELQGTIQLATSRECCWTIIPEQRLLGIVDVCLYILQHGSSSSPPTELSINYREFVKLFLCTLLNFGIDRNSQAAAKLRAMAFEEKWIPMSKVSFVIESIYHVATPAVH